MRSRYCAVPLLEWAAKDEMERVHVARPVVTTAWRALSVKKRSPTRQPARAACLFDAVLRGLMLVGTGGGEPRVVGEGIVTRHEVAPSNEPGQSTLTLTGEDVSVMMDILDMPFM